ncbi:MAG TPA: tetratricopeptide repeat protein [Allosphingosinicella sp.]|jgi:hypothetical protein
MINSIGRAALPLALLAIPAGAVAAGHDQPVLSAEAEFQRVSGAAQAAFNAGRFGDALMIARDAHAFAAGEFGPSHLLTLRTLNDMAVIHQMQGNHAAALPLALRASGELERTAGPDHPETLNALANLAQLHIRLDRRAEAEPLLRRVYAARERTLGLTNEATLGALLELAIFLNADRRLREIVALLDRGAAAARTALGPESGMAIDLADAAAAAKGLRPPSSTPANSPG